MKKFFILTMLLFLSSCASQLELEERAELRDKVDHEERINLGFIEGTEAYGGCRLTLKSIRAQNKLQMLYEEMV